MAPKRHVVAVVAGSLAVTLFAARANAEVRQGTTNCVSPRTLFLTIKSPLVAGTGRIENTATGASFTFVFPKGTSYRGGYVRSAWRVQIPTWASFESVTASCAL